MRTVPGLWCHPAPILVIPLGIGMRMSLRLGLGFAGLLLVTLAVAAPQVPTIASMAAYPKMSGFSLSPDGKHLAALEARGEDRVILVWSTDALSAPPTVIGSKQMKIRSVAFIKNDALAVGMWQPYDLHFDKTTKTFVTKLYFTDLQGKDWREPLPQPNAKSDVEEIEQSLSDPTVLDTLPNDPTHVLVVNDIGVNQGDIYKVEVSSGRAERVQRAQQDTAGYLTDLDGAVRARSVLSTDDKGAYIATEIRNAATGSWEEHFRSYAKDRDVVEVVGFGKDPNLAYVLSNVGRDKSSIREYDVAKRQFGNTVFEHKFFDAAGMRVSNFKDSHFGDIEWFTFDGPAEGERYYVSDWMQSLDRRVAAVFKIAESPQRLVDPATGASATVPMRVDRNWRLVSMSQDRSLVVVAVDSPTEPFTFYLLKDNKLQVLSPGYPTVDPAALGSSK
ncbi:MAG TPA: hypothetical protein VMT83_18650, partial [Burkholderiaceae bacterium]|nr:hypothetical protein [Burkholderiaceae bacterium]